MSYQAILKITIILILLLSSLFSQTMDPDEFVQILEKNHPLFLKENFSKEIELKNQQSLLGQQDWQLYSNFTISRENPAMAISGPERTDGITLDAGLEKSFWNTGSRLTLSASTARSKYKLDPMLVQLYGIPESFTHNMISLSYVHPLIKNAKGFFDKLPYDLKNFDIDIAKVQAQENKEAFLTNALTQYITWVLLEEQSKIARERFNLNTEELKRTIKKRKANLIDEVDVFRAKDAVTLAEQNMLLISSRLSALKLELSVLLKNEELIKMSPAYDLFKIESLNPIEQSIGDLNEKSRILKTLKTRMDQLKLVQQGHVEDHKPTLDIFTNMNTKKIDDELTESLKMSKYDVQVGLKFQVPLGKRTSKRNLEKTKLQIRQLKANYDEVQITLISQLRNLHLQIVEMEKILKLNVEQIHSSTSKTEEEIKLYNRGRGALTFVIQSRDSEEQAKLLYVQNAAGYQQLIINYRSLLDEIYN